jgi:hypothetical protein
VTQWAGVGARGGRERIENMGWTCVRNGWLPNVASSMKPVMGDVCAARVRGMWCSGLSHACAFHGRGRRGRGEKRDMELRAMFVDRLCRDLLGRHREAAAVRVCRARGALAARAPSDVYDARARDMAAGSLTRVLFVTQGRGGGGGDVGRPPDRDTCVSGTTCSGSSEARLQYVEVGAGGVATSGGRWTSGR